MHFKGFLSLILEEKELKQVCLKNNFFIATFSCFVDSKADLCIPRKKS